MNDSDVHLGTGFYTTENNILIKNASSEVKSFEEVAELSLIMQFVTYGCAAFFACCIIVWLGLRLLNYLLKIGSNTETSCGKSTNRSIHPDKVSHASSACESYNSGTPADKATFATSACSQVESTTTFDSSELHSELNRLKLICNGMSNMSYEKSLNSNFLVPATSCADTSIPLSSDMDTLWSSIDFDEFEESTIYENRRKNHSEDCFSTLFSEASFSVSDLINSNSVSSIEPYTQRRSSNLLRLTNPSADMVAQVLNFLREFVPKNRNVRLSLKAPSAHEMKKMPPSLRSWVSASESVNGTNSWVGTKTVSSSSESTNATTSPLSREFLSALSLRKSELSITSRTKMTILSTSDHQSPKPIDKKNKFSFTKSQCSSSLSLTKPLGTKFSTFYECVEPDIPCSQSVLSNSTSFKPLSVQDNRCVSVNFQEINEHQEL